MSDNLDIQIGLGGKKYCDCVCIGHIDYSLLQEVIDLIPRRDINASDAECAPVQEPIVVCPPDVTLQPEYPFDVGDPVTIEDILYGFYNFSTGNPAVPNVTDLQQDIINQPGNYQTTPWDPTGTDLSIITTEISYHLIRVPNTIGVIDIFDEAQVCLTAVCNNPENVEVTSGWTLFSDANYRYYLLQSVVAPSTVNYEIRQ